MHAKVLVELDEVDRNLVLLKPKDGDLEIVKAGDKGKVRNWKLYVVRWEISRQKDHSGQI